MQDPPAWLQYEREIYSELASKYSGLIVRHNVWLPGSRSGVLRQIDVLLEETLPGGGVVTAIDAKHHARKIDVKQVEAFLGLLRDVQVDRGMMISAKGYTKTAMGPTLCRPCCLLNAAKPRGTARKALDLDSRPANTFGALYSTLRALSGACTNQLGAYRFERP